LIELKIREMKEKERKIFDADRNESAYDRMSFRNTIRIPSVVRQPPKSTPIKEENEEDEN
jgi:hypothetical protein